MCSWARRRGSWGGLPIVPRTAPPRGTGAAVTFSATVRRSSARIPGTASKGFARSAWAPRTGSGTGPPPFGAGAAAGTESRR